MKAINRLRNIFDKKQKIQFVLLTGMMLIGGMLETVGISAVIPIVSAVMSPNQLQTGYMKILSDILQTKDTNQFIIYFGILFIVFYIIKSAYLFVMFYIQFKYIFDGQKYLAKKLFTIYMNKPYEFFVNTNSSKIQRTVTVSSNQTYSFVTTLMQLMTEIITVCFIATFLFIVDWAMTLAVIVILMLIVFIIKYYLEPATRAAGNLSKETSAQRTKWINQALAGVKEVIIGQHEEYFIDKFSKATSDYADSEKKVTFFNKIPKIIIELVSICGIMGYFFIIMSLGKNIVSMISVLAAFAMSLIKLMPSVGNISMYLNNLTYFTPGVEEVEAIIISEEKRWPDNVICKKKDMAFEHDIEMKNIEFTYRNKNVPVLNEADMFIEKGKSIGIKGPSGAGKTTAVDILLGLLIPQKGHVFVDGQDIENNYGGWLSMIGYIPQTIYLMDDTIRRNVAFGVNDEYISDERVWKALDEAQLAKHIEGLNEGLDTIVGERGIKFSGGQRQRLGIARALYKDPEILVFDEATSALDSETERAVMQAIDNMHGRKTMIIIAHRLKTIENCDIIYNVADGRIIKCEDYGGKE